MVEGNRFDRAYFARGFVFVVLYQILVVIDDHLIVLDTESFIDASLYFLPAGLSFSFVVIMGYSYLPFLAINPIINTYLNSRPWFIRLFLPILLPLIYGGSSFILEKWLHYKPEIISVRNLTKAIVVAIIAPAVVAFSTNLIILQFGNMSIEVFWQRVPSWYIGDLLGIFTLFPIFLTLNILYPDASMERAKDFVKSIRMFYFLLLNIIVFLTYQMMQIFSINLIFTLILPIMVISIMTDPKYTMFIGSYIPFEFSLLLTLYQYPLRVLEFQFFMLTVVLTTLFIAAIRQDNREIQEKLLHERVKRLEDAKFVTMGKLAGSISHDLNNTLTSAYLFVDRLEMQLMTEGSMEIHEMENLRSILDVNNKLIHRLQSLKSFSEEERSYIDLNRVIEKSRSTMESLMETKIKLDYDLEEKECIIIGNESLVEQLILNLVVNAKESISGEGSIVVRTSLENGRKEPMTVLEVEDTGSGIDETSLDKIFEIKYSTKERNSGLGLWIVSQIIESMEGAIIVDSKVGSGTSFICKFPNK